MSYATISVFGQPKNIYRETLMKFMISTANRTTNYPNYSTPIDLDSFILSNSDHDENQTELTDKKLKIMDDYIGHEALWHLYFDGLVNKSGARAGVWITNIETSHSQGHAFRLNFKCTNNMAEYEALILGLQIIRKLEGQRILVMGDSELVIKQINAEYSVHNPRLARYRDTTHDLVEDLLESKFAIIPRKQNLQAHCLATFANNCKFPFSLIQKYTAEIKYRPIFPDNVKYWQISQKMKKSITFEQ